MEQEEIEKYASLVMMYDRLCTMKKRVKDMEIDFWDKSNDLMPEIWEKFADGVPWETDANYHKGCDICQRHAVEAVREALGINHHHTVEEEE